ncbi:MAG TPA: hypothetical protein VJT74_08520, partial [Pyrinomonadaceae bacterium]|nr:hypothetical protein [Pyrinomonadaceae bacterium]
MKQCSTCREEFADKFSFCPVDGTPLAEQEDAPLNQQPLPETTRAFVPPPMPEQPTVQAESYAVDAGESVQPEPPASTALVPANEYHLTFVDDTGLTRRLMGELKEVAHNSELTWPEFKRDPFGYSRRFVTGYGSLVWRFFSRKEVAIATSTALLIVLTAAIGFVVY